MSPAGNSLSETSVPWAWVLRATVWFTTASILTTILHESAHAVAAFALGVRSTLFSYFVDLDLTELQMNSGLPVIIRLAGPTFCLVFGIVSWSALRRARGSAAELPWLYLSAFGVSTFFGNMMSMSFVGDFSRVAVDLRLPMAVRYGGTAIGALVLAGIQFWLGRQLVQWVPAPVGRVAGTLGIVVLPTVLGTAAVILVNQPMPGAFVGARVGEASFSLFAVVGALMTGRDSVNGSGPLRLRWADSMAIVLAVMMVRLTVGGIPFVP